MALNACARRLPSAAAAAIAAVLILLVTAAVAAAGVSLRDRGPCPDTVDGVCIPNRKNFGFYAPKWRPWPGARPAAVAPGESVLEHPLPAELQPFEVPPPEEEATGPTAPGPHGPHAAAEGPPTTLGQPETEAEDAPPPPPASLQDHAPLPGGQEHGPSGTVPQLPLPREPLLPEPTPGAPKGAGADQPGGHWSGLVWRPVGATPAITAQPTAADGPLLDAAGSGNAVKDSGSRIRENSGRSQYPPKSGDFGYGQNSVNSSQKSPSRRWGPGRNPLRIGATGGQTGRGRLGQIEPVRRAVFTASIAKQSAPGSPSTRHRANPLRSR